MTSKFKAPTDDTPPLSSAEGIAAKVPPSELSASSDNTLPSTQIMSQPSQPMLSADRKDLTTPPTTVKVTEKSRQHAMLAKVALKQLETAGLIRRFKVLSTDGQHPTKIRIEFDLTLWSEELDLL